MRTLRLIGLLLLAGLPAVLWADFGASSLPANAKWYFHTDFDAMRKTTAGQHLYKWLQGEVFDEIRDEIGVDLDKEAERIVAFGSGHNGLTVVVDGNISQETRDKLIAVGAATGAMDQFEAGGDTYYYVKNTEADGEEHTEHEHDHDYDFDSLQHGAYFSFAVRNKLIVTSSEAEMKAMLESKGRIKGANRQEGALVVLSADSSLIQAGLNAEDFEDEIDWDSNIVRNTRQVALLIADEKGKLAIKAQLLAAEKEMAESLASIVRGLISLQVFNDDLDPDISNFLRNTTVDVDGTALTIAVALDPEAVVAAIE